MLLPFAQNLLTIPYFLFVSALALLCFVTCVRDLVRREMRVDQGTALNMVCTMWTLMSLVGAWFLPVLRSLYYKYP